MQSRKYARKGPVIGADMERERQEDDNQHQSDQDAEPKNILYAYPITIGGVEGVLHTREEVAPEFFTEMVDAQEPQTNPRPTTRKAPPYFLHFLLVLMVFVLLDNVDSFFTQLAPTVTIAIQPVTKTVSTMATVSVGGVGADVQGRVLAPLVLSQQLTRQATGQGHQKATTATGALIYFNGSFTSYTVRAGTVYTGRDGIQVATTESVTIPAAQPGNPPQFGEASVSATAMHPGARGNIAAGDISLAGSTLQVSNSQFQYGRDARDFTTVTHADIDQPAATLKAQVTQSMLAALQEQVRAGEQMLSLPCSPTTSANHGVGDEALQVRVTVSQTCQGLVYNTLELQQAAIKRLTTQAVRQLGTGYTLFGNMQVSVTQATTTNKKKVVLVFSARGTWVYQITETHIQALVLGKPRLTALHLVAETPGVQTVSIAGVSDNQLLPTDSAHIHLLIFIEG